jgi:hypothetical protein
MTVTHVRNDDEHARQLMRAAHQRYLHDRRLLEEAGNYVSPSERARRERRNLLATAAERRINLARARSPRHRLLRAEEPMETACTLLRPEHARAQNPRLRALRAELETQTAAVRDRPRDSRAPVVHRQQSPLRFTHPSGHVRLVTQNDMNNCLNHSGGYVIQSRKRKHSKSRKSSKSIKSGKSGKSGKSQRKKYSKLRKTRSKR